jgi:hypothetical protein
MTEKGNREGVIAEITSSLMRLASEHGGSLSREQAFAFPHQEGRAFEMWKHMMHSGEGFIARSELRPKATPKRSSREVRISRPKGRNSTKPRRHQPR